MTLQNTIISVQEAVKLNLGCFITFRTQSHQTQRTDQTTKDLAIHNTQPKNAQSLSLDIYITIHYVGRDSVVGTSWTVRGSNPGGGEIFSIRPDWPWGLPSLLYNGYRVISRG